MYRELSAQPSFSASCCLEATVQTKQTANQANMTQPAERTVRFPPAAPDRHPASSASRCSCKPSQGSDDLVLDLADFKSSAQLVMKLKVFEAHVTIEYRTKPSNAGRSQI
jgi:hypothetical protein